MHPSDCIRRIWSGYREKVERFQELSRRLGALEQRPAGRPRVAVSDAGVQGTPWSEFQTKLDQTERQLASARGNAIFLKEKLQKAQRAAEEERREYEKKIFELHQEIRHQTKASDTSILGRAQRRLGSAADWLLRLLFPLVQAITPPPPKSGPPRGGAWTRASPATPPPS